MLGLSISKNPRIAKTAGQDSLGKKQQSGTETE